MSNFISCAVKDMTPEQLASALLTKNAAGEMAIRVMFIDGCSSDAIDCNNSNLTAEQKDKLTIGISECGKPALRLALPKGTFLNNILTFANDTAAAVGGIPVGGIYFKTGIGLSTRMA